MGTTQTFDIDQSWATGAELLDATFPLAEGSHRDVVDYLVLQDHLVTIDVNGRCTGLARPGQFVEAGGSAEQPRSILLAHGELQVEIEPCNRAAAAAGKCREHRVQRVVALAAA